MKTESNINKEDCYLENSECGKRRLEGQKGIEGGAMVDCICDCVLNEGCTRTYKKAGQEI